MQKRYFKNGQKIILRTLTPDGYQPPQLLSLTAYFRESRPGFFDLHLPYELKEGEEYPFAVGTRFEIQSDTLGLGLRLTGRFQEWRSRDLIRVAVENDLHVFQRRVHPRLDATIGLRFTRGRGVLRTFHEHWRKNANVLQLETASSKLGDLPRTRVNLSPGGIRFKLKAPVEVADLALMVLELEPAQRAICVLAEVMWAGEAREERQTAGMRFINILEADLKRIEEFIRENWAQSRED
jgi:hypothetical protein